MSDVTKRPRKPRKAAPKPPPGAARRSRRKPATQKVTGSPQKIKLRGRDERSLTIPEAIDGLYQAIRVIKGFDSNYRLKWASLFFVAIDNNGNEVTLVPNGEMLVNPYDCAADEFGA